MSEAAWDLSCRDWEARLLAGRSLVPELPLYREEADVAVGFFNQLRLPDVPGNPMLREGAGDWFRDIVAALFGSRNPATNERHIRELFVLVGKGNAKTTYGAAMMITALLMNVRPRAEYLFVGPTQAIADLAFSQAAGMVELDRELSKRFKVRDHLKEIVDRTLGAKLKVKTFDLSILTGPRPSGVLLDELHLLGKHHATSKVLAQIRGGLEKMTEGFLAIITTQSDEPPTGAFKDELKMARTVRDGDFAGRVLPVLYEFPEAIARDQAKWEDPTKWPLVMPNLGRSLRIASLVQAWNAERVKGAHAVQIWASQHLNIEIGIGLKTDRWRGADNWLAAAEPGLSLATILERSEVVVAGIDGGGLDDLLALAILGRLPPDPADEGLTVDQDGNPQNHLTRRRWALWVKCWVDRSVLDLRKSEAARFLDLEKAGDLTIVDDLEVAYAELAGIVAQVDEAALLAKVGLDPMGVGAIVDALAARNIEGDSRIVGISQGWQLTGPIKTTETKVKNRTLVHCGQPIMTWAVGNAKTEPRGNAVMITKAVSGTGKIDPLMATFNAVQLMSRNPPAVESLKDQLYFA